MDTVRGSCLCGDVAWEAAAPFELMHHCHCSICRKLHGAAFETAVGAPAEGFRWLRGEGQIARERLHIFVGSKAPWHEISDELPQLEEMPPSSS